MLKNSDFSELEKFFEDSQNNPFVWGFSFNRGADGKPKFEQFGDFFKKMGFNKGPVHEHERVREPLVDIIEEDTVLRVIVELPGVEKSQIDLSTKKKSVKIKAISDARTYKKIINLPVEVFPKTARAKFNNGVLEITLKRIEQASP
jgi:HSP20 family protein